MNGGASLSMRAFGKQQNTPTSLKMELGDQSESEATPMSLGKGMTTALERRQTGWRATSEAGWSKQTMGTTINFNNDTDVGQTPRAAGN